MICTICETNATPPMIGLLRMIKMKEVIKTEIELMTNKPMTANDNSVPALPSMTKGAK